jgi:hypothetical protein
MESTTRLTAAKARELSGPAGQTVSERVDAALELVRKAATARKRKLTLHDYFWVNEGYGRTENWTEAVKQLEALGYKVTFFYNERTSVNLLNMYTVIEW